MNDQITNSIRESYDRVADEYAARIFRELEHKPFDCALLDGFAAEVRGRGPVCDMGCGPGQVARYLHDAGVTVFGLDLSAGMVAQARRLSPEISFRAGNMCALDLEAEELAGIAAFYAIVNIPRESLPVVFGEMARVLRPGGRLLLAFHVGDETLRETELWGRPIRMDFFLFSPGEIARGIESSGLVVDKLVKRDPYPPEVEYQSRRAYILARKPEPSSLRLVPAI
jgi:SAM-dependent methyltransferase